MDHRPMTTESVRIRLEGFDTAGEWFAEEVELQQATIEVHFDVAPFPERWTIAVEDDDLAVSWQARAADRLAIIPGSVNAALLTADRSRRTTPRTG